MNQSIQTKLETVQIAIESSTGIRLFTEQIRELAAATAVLDSKRALEILPPGAMLTFNKELDRHFSLMSDWAAIQSFETGEDCSPFEGRVEVPTVNLSCPASAASDVIARMESVGFRATGSYLDGVGSKSYIEFVIETTPEEPKEIKEVGAAEYEVLFNDAIDGKSKNSETPLGVSDRLRRIADEIESFPDEVGLRLEYTSSLCSTPYEMQIRPVA